MTADNGGDPELWCVKTDVLLGTLPSEQAKKLKVVARRKQVNRAACLSSSVQRPGRERAGNASERLAVKKAYSSASCIFRNSAMVI
jgi:hypothetical protein